jgi:hypothetical protein
MTMRYAAISALLLFALAGCIYPQPVSVREQGTYFVYPAWQEPLKAARCMVRNTEERSPGLIATERRSSDAYGWEVIVSDGTGVVATVRTDVVAILVSIEPSRRPDNERFANELVHGC